MKNQQFKQRVSIVFLLLLAGIMLPLTAQKANKKIAESYSVRKGFTLGIENVYGEINITSWERDEVSVTVTIETEAGSQSKADAMLDDIEISISESSNAVYFETDIDVGSMKGNKKVNVAYEVKAPAYINAAIEQKYGDVYIQELTGVADLEIMYGGLVAGALTPSTDAWNSLELAYGNADIERASPISAEIKYSEITIDNAVLLEIESAYSELYLGEVGELELESKYDKLKVKSLLGSMEIESAYTQVTIDMVSSGFEEIDAEMTYGNFTAGLENGTSFDIEAEVVYGSVRIPDGSWSSEKQGNKQEISGTVGRGGKGSITVDMKYGNLLLK